jgi:phosphate acetyltransferase
VATSIYLASTHGPSGKSAFAVGLLEHLARTAGRVAVFRPIVRTTTEPDPLLELLMSRLSLGDGPARDPQACFGVTYDDMHEDQSAAMSRILDRFHDVDADSDVVLVVGSDYTDVVNPTEFTDNAEIAANMGAPMIVLLPADGRDGEDLATAAEIAIQAAHTHHAHVLGVIVNRVDKEQGAIVRRVLNETHPDLTTWTLPDNPLLRAPTMRDLMGAVDGTLIHGDGDLLDRETTEIIVGAMTLPHVLDRIHEGSVVITPADREEIVLGVLQAHSAETYPHPAGIVTNGGFEMSPQVRRLLDGLGSPLPIVACDQGTMTTAKKLSKATGRIAPTSTRKIDEAVELVARHVDVGAMLSSLDLAPSGAVTPLMFEHRLVDRAQQAESTIVLPEGLEDRVLRAADIVLDRMIADLVLLGDPDAIRARAAALGIDLRHSRLIDPETDPLRDKFAGIFAELRAHKGVTHDMAHDIVSDPSYFGTMMVLTGEADGMVSGSITTTAATVRPALEVVRTQSGVSVVSSVFLMCLADRVLVYGDCAINPDPTAEQLADIAISSARTAAQFGIEPRVAMLSYSTGASGSGADVEKVRAATALVRERAPQLLVEGPIQYDAAVDPAVAATKLKDSEVAGRATVLIFPDLNTGNNTYKAVQRSASAVAIGPVLQGLNKPVNDLSRGALVEDIVNTIAITAIQAGEA